MTPPAKTVPMTVAAGLPTQLNETKRQEHQQLKHEHRASFENEPQNAEETWTPETRAWGDGWHDE
jgi:hypothetical protein